MTTEEGWITTATEYTVIEDITESLNEEKEEDHLITNISETTTVSNLITNELQENSVKGVLAPEAVFGVVTLATEDIKDTNNTTTDNPTVKDILNVSEVPDIIVSEVDKNDYKSKLKNLEQ